MNLYHGSNEENLRVVSDSGLFAGVFCGGQEVAESHGSAIYQASVENVFFHGQEKKLSAKKLTVARKAVRDELSVKAKMSRADFAALVSAALADDETLLPENFNAANAFGGWWWDAGIYENHQAGWGIQRLRGKIAAALGYDAVEMNDEHGTTYLVLPGAKLEKIS